MWFFLKEILLPLFLIVLLVCLSLLAVCFITLGLIQLIKDIVSEFTDYCFDNSDEDDILSDEDIKRIHDEIFNKED